MSRGFPRQLTSNAAVDEFVRNVLDMKDATPRERNKVVNKIVAAERNIAGAGSHASTLRTEFRHINYQQDDKRNRLRNKIVKELIENERLPDDDKIRPGHGGAKPTSGVRADKKAFYVIGPPASGKSGISNKIADLYGAYILDSDYAKRKLPEYSQQVGGASLVHEESDLLIFSNEPNNLLKHCFSHGYNIVIPKIGHNKQSIIDFCQRLVKGGYSVFLISVDLDRYLATRRAFTRYKKTNRYVPLSVIFDAYGNEPTLNYFKIKQGCSNMFSGFAQISTDVGIGESPVMLEQTNLDELLTVFGEVGKK